MKQRKRRPTATEVEAATAARPVKLPARKQDGNGKGKLGRNRASINAAAAQASVAAQASAILKKRARRKKVRGTIDPAEVIEDQELERKVFQLRAQKIPFHEIAAILNTNLPQVRNAFERAFVDFNGDTLRLTQQKFSEICADFEGMQRTAYVRAHGGVIVHEDGKREVFQPSAEWMRTLNAITRGYSIHIRPAMTIMVQVGTGAPVTTTEINEQRAAELTRQHFSTMVFKPRRAIDLPTAGDIVEMKQDVVPSANDDKPAPASVKKNAG